MDIRNYVKILCLVSVFSLSLILIVAYFTGNLLISIIIGSLADSIQIATYIIWILRKEVSLEKVPQRVEEIHHFITYEKKESEAKERLISKLINEGVVREEELYSLIRNKEIILAFPYGEGLRSSIKSTVGYKRQPLANLLEKLRFVRVTRVQNLMVAFTDNLPKNLRNIENLNYFIKKQLPEDWKLISEKIKQRFPASQYPKKFEKWRTGEKFSVMYILAKSLAHEFLIDFINKETFTDEFKKHIWKSIDRRELRKVIKRKRHKVKEIISKISVDFLLSNVPRRIRDKIVENEEKLKDTLGIKIFTDYRLIDKEELTQVLTEIIPRVNKEDLERFSSTIIQESQSCYDLLNELGISLEP